MTPRSESLEIALKTLWGASKWPGLAESTVVVAHPGWQEAMKRLEQLASVRSSGILHGAHGTGKSTLLHRWGAKLPSKQYRILRIAHSSLHGSDLLRYMVKLSGRTPLFRKGDNVAVLGEIWQEWAPAWPIVIVEEAQDVNTAALEELRLLTCSKADATPPFSLVLCGDNELMPRMNLGINQALLSRLGYCIRLDRWSMEAIKEYLTERLAEVGIHNTPLEPAAEMLLLQSANGIPRAVNALLQRSMEQAAMAQRRNVTAADVQAALDLLPWLARSRTEL
jgi:type II secretory pathway predicted ATPase ExeA